jgi:uncharacterized membrane protein YphA (DoxX/SURF4 family)
LDQRTNHIFTLLLRWTLGGMFLWAGVIKLANPKAFARSIDAFGLVPEAFLPPVAILLPITEIFVGLAVLRRWRFGLPAMAALLLVFMAVLGFAISQNLDVDCGCFSVAEQREHTSVKAALVRDLLMLAGVICLGKLARRTRAVTPQGPAPISSEQGE